MAYYTLKKMQEIAAERGGEVLSKKLADHTQLRFRCSQGHTWVKLPRFIAAGSWCPKCEKRSYPRYTIESASEFAKKHGIKCIADKYENNYTKIEWQCSEGHKFKESFSGLRKRKNMCPECPRKPYKGKIENLKLKLELVQQIAKQNGGQVLSKTADTDKIKFKCNQGHVWETMFHNAKKGSWCQKCYIERISQQHRLTIKFIQEFAKRRGGTCLSAQKDYKTVSSLLKWKCLKGHKFEETYQNIKQRSRFCKECN